MALHWLGAAFLIMGCGSAGFIMAGRDRKSVEQMRALIDILNFCHCELSYRLTPLPELCRGAAGLGKGEVHRVFSKLAQELENQILPDAGCCMTAALSACPSVSQRVCEHLTGLGQALGQFDLEGQLRGLEGIRERCVRVAAAMEETLPQRQRTYRTLGLCAGAAMAVLFI